MEDIGKFRSARVEARKAGEPSEQPPHTLSSGSSSGRATGATGASSNGGPSASRWSNDEANSSPRKVMLRTSGGIADGSLSPSSKKTVSVDDEASFPALSPPPATTVAAKPSRAELDEDGRWKKTPLPEKEEARPKSKADEATSWRRGGAGGGGSRGALSNTGGRQAGAAKTQATTGTSTSRWAHAGKKANDKEGSARSKEEKSGDDLVKELDRLDLK